MNSELKGSSHSLVRAEGKTMKTLGHDSWFPAEIKSELSSKYKPWPLVPYHPAKETLENSGGLLLHFLLPCIKGSRNKDLDQQIHTALTPVLKCKF
jgi:hypothetical protein